MQRGTNSRAMGHPMVRKVRTPQGRVPVNGRAPRGDGKCNRKYTAPVETQCVASLQG